MGGIVLMYHRVDACTQDPLAMRVRPEHFQEQVRRLDALAEVVPLTEIRTRGRRRRVAITFDDGYRDNLTTAAPILREKGLPATIFVTRAGGEPDAHFWWDRVEHLVLDGDLRVEFLELDLGGRHVRVDVRTAAGRQRAAAMINHRLVRAGRDEIDRLVAQLDEQTGTVEWPCELHDRLSDDDLRTLGSAGLSVGGHTRTHRMLTTLPQCEQREEVAGIRHTLERVTRTPVTTFAYPFGGRDAYAPDTVRAVRDAGYELACTTEIARVGPGTHRYRIPRLGVDDWDGSTFAARVQRLFELGV